MQWQTVMQTIGTPSNCLQPFTGIHLQNGVMLGLLSVTCKINTFSGYQNDAIFHLNIERGSEKRDCSLQDPGAQLLTISVHQMGHYKPVVNLWKHSF